MSGSPRTPSEGEPLTPTRRPVLTAVLIGCLILLALHTWVAEPLRIQTTSMVPTLKPGEHVLASKLGGASHSWRRGEVVVLGLPGGDELIVKRIVAVGGDTVALRDGRLFVDGRRVRESYADPNKIDSVYFGPVHVPAGHVFVLGDNRRESLDSRNFGPVASSAIEGRVLTALWPLSNAFKGIDR